MTRSVKMLYRADRHVALSSFAWHRPWVARSEHVRVAPHICLKAVSRVAGHLQVSVTTDVSEGVSHPSRRIAFSNYIPDSHATGPDDVELILHRRVTHVIRYCLCPDGVYLVMFKPFNGLTQYCQH